MKMLFRVFAVVGMLAGTVPGLAAAAETAAPLKGAKPLPRIGVRATGRGAEFCVRSTGARFIPKGFNHTVLGKWHATFNTDLYDRERMETALSQMQTMGANTVRVWIWGHQDEHGYTGAETSLGLNPEYMENVMDFLRRAAAHDIYVIAVMDETPHNAKYTPIVAQGDAALPLPAVTGYNRQYMTPGLIAAKCAAVQDFIRYIQKRDPNLLSTVIAWSMANEVFVNATDGPFAKTEGQAEGMSGKAYDMADKASRQACYDDSILLCANAFAEAVKQADGDALVTAGLWTADAHGREAFNGLPLDGKDARICPRPSVLGAKTSRLDFLDLHIYPWDGTPKVRPETHEYEAVRAGGKAVLVGETGVFKNKTMDEAKQYLREMVDQAYALGYAGHLLWVWDLSMVPGQTWSAIEGDLGGFAMTLGPKP